jgi:hypothetical protein
MMAYKKPLPNLENEVEAPHWQAAKQGRLSVQRCSECGYLRWPPEMICPECLTRGGEWVDLKGEGEIWSFAVYHRAMNPAFSDEVPYAVAMIRLVEGIEMIGRIAGPPGEIHIGQKVRAVYVPVTDEVTLVQWQPSM